MYTFQQDSARTVNMKPTLGKLNLPAFHLDEFPVAERAAALQRYCSTVLSQFSYHGIKALSMLLRIDEHDIYHPVLELTTPDQSVPLTGHTAMVYHVTMFPNLELAISSQSVSDAADISLTDPECIVAYALVTVTSEISKHTWVAELKNLCATAPDVTVSDTVDYHGDDLTVPINTVSSVFGNTGVRGRVGSCHLRSGHKFEVELSEQYIHRLMRLRLHVPGQPLRVTFGFNGLIKTGYGMRSRLEKAMDLQLTSVLLPRIERPAITPDDWVTACPEERAEPMEGYGLRELGHQLPRILPLVELNPNVFVDTDVVVPFTVAAGEGFQASSYLQLPHGNLFDTSAVAIERHNYRIEPTIRVGDMIARISWVDHTTSEQHHEIHKMVVNADFSLKPREYGSRHRFIDRAFLSRLGCLTYTGHESAIIPDVGQGVTVAMEVELDLESGRYRFRECSVTLVPEGDMPDMTVTVLGWYPDGYFERTDGKPYTITSKVPAHLEDIAYGTYLGALGEVSPPMTREQLLAYPNKELTDEQEIIKYFRGLGAQIYAAHLKQTVEQETAAAEMKMMSER